MSDLEFPDANPLSDLLREYAEQIRNPEVENEFVADNLDRIAALTSASPGVGWCTIALPYAPLYVEYAPEGLRYTCAHSPSHTKSI